MVIKLWVRVKLVDIPWHLRGVYKHCLENSAAGSRYSPNLSPLGTRNQGKPKKLKRLGTRNQDKAKSEKDWVLGTKT